MEKVKSIISQQQFLKLIVPLFRESGRMYRKTRNVWARKAVGGERIETHTADGQETVNTASAGDIIVRNQTEAQEQYILPLWKFENRYEFLRKGNLGFDEYRSTGKTIAIAVSPDLLAEWKMNPPFYFTASWGESMVVKNGDYLACPPDYSEVYRIAQKEFGETYSPF